MRRRDILRGIGAFSAGALVGCSKSGPTSPSGVPGGTGSVGSAMIVDALRTGAPVAGAVVTTADGVQHATSPDGSVAVSNGGIVNITAPAQFGPRRIKAAAGIHDWLLPDDSQMPGWWIKEALYGANDFQWLWRPLPGALLVVPAADVFADDFAMDAIRQGVGIINGVHRYVSYTVGVPGQTASRIVQVTLNPSVNAFAQTSIKATGATTIGALIEFSTFHLDGFPRSLQQLHAIRAVAHELAHVSGLSGHPTPIAGVYTNGMMYGAVPVQEFAQPEADILNWMFFREPGTRPPDDSSATPVVAQNAEPRWHQVCRFNP